MNRTRPVRIPRAHHPRRRTRLRQLLTAGVLAFRGVDLVQRALQRPRGPYTYMPPLALRLYADFCIWVDQRVGWPNLPPPIGLAILLGERVKLRQDNLVDTTVFSTLPQPDPQASGTAYLRQRTIDGTFNDLRDPRMGSAGTRFGRNVPNEFTWPDPQPLIMSPNPRVVSRELFTRDQFVPATSLNMLAAAWIQFMTRDWFTHGTGDINNPWQVPLPAGDSFPQNPMLIPRTIADPTRPADDRSGPPTHVNLQTAWWDGSQLYPPDPQVEKSVRTGSGGQLRLVAEAGEQQLPPPLLDELAQVPGWWVGLALLLTVFAREHNAICDRLAAEYPSWSDEQLFQQARLINAGLLAKIHTLEWTPAIIAHPTTQMAMNGNWWGIGGKRLNPLLSRLFPDNEIMRGIPGTPTEHHAAPYSLTEEFVAVYRMHSLIRDEYSLRRAGDDSAIAERTFDQLTDVRGNQALQSTGAQDLLYSFGTLYPGALQLHNYPRLMQQFTRPDGKIADLAAIDILRMREFGVPRYTLFRELLHLRPITRFEDLTDNPQWARQLRDVYEGRIDRVDLMAGMFAEPKPAGFGFSDTAFRIFILMASRRLKSDRFFGPDFTPEVYTPLGLQWVNDTSMVDVLRRHYPALAPRLAGVDNAFTPWPGARA